MIKMQESRAKEVLQSYADYVNGTIDEFPYSFVVFRAAQNFMEGLNNSVKNCEGSQGFDVSKLTMDNPEEVIKVCISHLKNEEYNDGRYYSSFITAYLYYILKYKSKQEYDAALAEIESLLTPACMSRILGRLNEIPLRYDFNDDDMKLFLKTVLNNLAGLIQSWEDFLLSRIRGNRL